MSTKFQKEKHWTRFLGQSGKIALYRNFQILEIDDNPLLGLLWNPNMISLDQLTISEGGKKTCGWFWVFPLIPCNLVVISRNCSAWSACGIGLSASTGVTWNHYLGPAFTPLPWEIWSAAKSLWSARPTVKTFLSTIHMMTTSDLIKHIDLDFLSFTLCTGLFGAWFFSHNHCEPGEITCRFLICSWGQLKGSGIWGCMTGQFGQDPAATGGLYSLCSLQCNSEHFSCNAERQIRLHPPNLSTEVLLWIGLHQTFWPHSVNIKKIYNSHVWWSKRFHKTFW